MGLTKEQWKEKRISELYDYVSKHGHKVQNIVYWDTYPICVKDICVLGVAIVNDSSLEFGDNTKEGFICRRKAIDLERKWLEEAIEDMKQLDKNKK